VRQVLSWISVSLLLLGLCPVAGPAQIVGVAPQHHPWGSFKPGAWKLVRVVTETLDDKGQVVSTSITETKTTLVQVTADSVTLKVAVCVEVAGKRFDPDPQTVKQGLHGEMIGQELKFNEAGTAQAIIERQKVPCKVMQIQYAGPNSKTVTKLYYSPTVAPYVLKRESVSTDLEGKNILSEKSVGVIARNMPCKVLAEIKSTSFVKAVQKHSKGTVITWAWTSTDVPGGIIGHSSKELDKAGRLIRRSTLELLDYGSEPEPGRIGIFGRRPLSRFHRSAAPR